MNFLVDNQLPPALARLIEVDLGSKATHVADIGRRDFADLKLWQYASQNHRIVISKDDDFAQLILRKPTAKLNWVRVGNCRKAFLLDLFCRTWPRIIERLASGDSLIELR